MPSDNVKKLIAYAAILAVIAGAVLVVMEVSLTRQAVRNPGLFATEPPDGRPSPRQPRDEPLFVKPPARGEDPLSPSEVAWVLRERVALDVIGDFMTRGADASAYNERIREYNGMASSIRASDNALSTAKRRVIELKGEIVEESLREAMEIAAPRQIKGDTRAETVWEAQTYLRKLGVFSGRPDGVSGGDTDYAVRTFQIRAGMEITGEIDDKLLSRLRADYAEKKVREDISVE
jgi:hypothetical protein